MAKTTLNAFLDQCMEVQLKELEKNKGKDPPPKPKKRLLTGLKRPDTTRAALFLDRITKIGFFKIRQRPPDHDDDLWARRFNPDLEAGNPAPETFHRYQGPVQNFTLRAPDDLGAHVEEVAEDDPGDLIELQNKILEEQQKMAEEDDDMGGFGGDEMREMINDERDREFAMVTFENRMCFIVPGLMRRKNPYLLDEKGERIRLPLEDVNSHMVVLGREALPEPSEHSSSSFGSRKSNISYSNSDRENASNPDTPTPSALLEQSERSFQESSEGGFHIDVDAVTWDDSEDEEPEDYPFSEDPSSQDGSDYGDILAATYRTSLPDSYEDPSRLDSYESESGSEGSNRRAMRRPYEGPPLIMSMNSTRGYNMSDSLGSMEDFPNLAVEYGSGQERSGDPTSDDGCVRMISNLMSSMGSGWNQNQLDQSGAPVSLFDAMVSDFKGGSRDQFAPAIAQRAAAGARATRKGGGREVVATSHKEGEAGAEEAGPSGLSEAGPSGQDAPPQ